MDKALTIQQKMRSEMLDKSIFDQASEYAHKYLDQATDRNVYPTEEALIGLKQFDEDMPQESTEASDILHHLNQYGAPNTVSQIGGRYFGFVNGGVVPAGLAAKNLSIFWDQNTAMQVISPISSKLESVVEKWLRQLFDLPSQTCAGYVSGTSSATFCGLAAARYRLLKGMDWDINAKGLFNAPGLRIVTSTHAHSTVIKAISLLGFGTDNIEWVECDDQGRIKPELMPALDSSTIVILQAGNVNNGSFDDFET
ncbi:MAG: pyridoxal-dependent decarboxylase, partial [Bacteroidota bacterium]